MSSILYNCPLCHGVGENFYNQEFQKCSVCQSIFRCPEYFLSPEKEKGRYERHNNDVYDSGYQAFVLPLVNRVLQHHTSNEVGLDFGAGTGPVISHLLGEKGLHLDLYDPFFHNRPELLTQKYDYIISCEVIEHFYSPLKEFQLLDNLLKPQGKLYIMTDLYDSHRDFGSWNYKNDLTHVFFYSKESLNWIQKNMNWEKYILAERLIIFGK